MTPLPVVKKSLTTETDANSGSDNKRMRYMTDSDSKYYTVVTVTIVNEDGETEAGTGVVDESTDLDEAKEIALQEANERYDDNIAASGARRYIYQILEVPIPKAMVVSAKLSESDSEVKVTIS